MTPTDDPAMLDAQRRRKHEKRIPFVYRADARLTPLEQWTDKVRAVLQLADVLERAAGRKGVGR